MPSDTRDGLRRMFFNLFVSLKKKNLQMYRRLMNIIHLFCPTATEPCNLDKFCERRARVEYTRNSRTTCKCPVSENLEFVSILRNVFECLCREFFPPTHTCQTFPWLNLRCHIYATQPGLQ